MKNRTTYSSINHSSGTASGSHFAYDHSEEETNFKTAVISVGAVTLEFIAMLAMAAIILVTYMY